jgi:cellulose synthase/poly-beta-1,6-N-acetylglucosamine synthase-like glycosyltransferase
LGKRIAAFFWKKGNRKKHFVFFLYTKQIRMWLVIIVMCSMSIFFLLCHFFLVFFARLIKIYFNIKNMKKQLKTIKMAYMAPQVEAMEARVERGFILSNVQSDGNSTIESFTEAGSATWA